MKSGKKNLLFCIFFFFMLSFLFALPVNASVSTSNCKVNFNSFTDNSITISWTPPAIQNDIYSYSSYKYNIKKYYVEIDDNIVYDNVSPSATGVVLSGMGKGWAKYVYVKCVYIETYTNSSGNVSTNEYTRTIGSVKCNTTPDNITTKAVSPSNASIYLRVALPANASGFEYQICRADNNKVVKKGTGYSSANVDLKYNLGYKYRVRSYYTNNSTNKTYYGAWSGYGFFAMPKIVFSTGSGIRGVQIKLPKTKGIKGYIISVSKNRDTGYKKTTTVSTTGKKKTVTIRKMGKKKLKSRTSYYIRVIPRIKNGKKVAKSEFYSYRSMYVYKN